MHIIFLLTAQCFDSDHHTTIAALILVPYLLFCVDAKLLQFPAWLLPVITTCIKDRLWLSDWLLVKWRNIVSRGIMSWADGAVQHCAAIVVVVVVVFFEICTNIRGGAHTQEWKSSKAQKSFFCVSVITFAKSHQRGGRNEGEVELYFVASGHSFTHAQTQINNNLIIKSVLREMVRSYRAK